MNRSILGLTSTMVLSACQGFTGDGGGATSTTSTELSGTESTSAQSGATSGTSGDCPDGCPATAHATGSCVSGACVYACADGFADCDADKTTCEADLMSPDSCGACGVSCTTKSCKSISGTPTCNDPTSIVAGDNHTCALLLDGTVWCWGHNFFGQVGAGSPKTIESSPSLVVLPTTATQISARGDSSCAVLSDHTLACWGRNGTPGTVPHKVIGLPTSVSVSVGGNFAGGSQIEGDTLSATQAGQLSEFIVDSVLAEAVGSVQSGVAGFAAGGAHICWFDSNHVTTCMGNNTQDQVGDFNSPIAAHPAFVVSSVSSTSLAAGENFTCAITVSNDVACWGNDTNGQTGIVPIGSPITPPHGVDIGTEKAQSIVAGHHHAGVITSLGNKLFLWGVNDKQQTSPAAGDQKTPQHYVGLDGVLGVALGSQHSCVIMPNHEIRCWGAGGNGQIGNAMMTDVSTPTAVAW